MSAIRAARRGRGALLIVMLFTSACASIPNLGSKPEPLPASDYAASQSLAGSSAQWPGQGWWQQYGDPQLTGLINEALAGSPDLQAAAARMRTAEGFVQRAGAALEPQVDAFAQADASKLSQNSSLPPEAVPKGWNDSGAVGLAFSFDLDLWGKNRAAFRATKLDAEAARYEYQEAALGLSTGIAATYANLLSLYAQRDSLEGAVGIRAQTAKLVGQRVQIGLDNEAALRQADARVWQAGAELKATDEAIALAKNALAALVGAGPDRALSIARPAMGTLHTQDAPSDASIDLVGRRPDIAAGRARLDAASQRIREARAAFYPNINLTALIGLQAFGLGNLFSGDSTFGSAGPAVSLPIFHGGALQGQYRGRRGQYDEAVALYNGTVLKALRETADAVTSQRALAPRLTDSRRALADFEAAHRLARLRYGQGLATYLDVLTAEEGVVQARLAVAQLETRAFTLDVQLIRALGGGFTAA